MASFNIQRVTGAPGVPCPFRGWLEPLLPLYVRSTDESTVHQGQCCEPEPGQTWTSSTTLTRAMSALCLQSSRVVSPSFSSFSVKLSDRRPPQRPSSGHPPASPSVLVQVPVSCTGTVCLEIVLPVLCDEGDSMTGWVPVPGYSREDLLITSAKC